MIRETVLGLALATGTVVVVPPQDTAPEPTNRPAAANVADDLQKEIEALHKKAQALLERAAAVEHNGDEKEAQKMRTTAERLLQRAADLLADRAAQDLKRANAAEAEAHDRYAEAKARYETRDAFLSQKEHQKLAEEVDRAHARYVEFTSQAKDESTRARRQAKIDEAKAKAHELLLHAGELQRQGHLEEAMDILRKADQLSTQANDLTTQNLFEFPEQRRQLERQGAAMEGERRVALEALRAPGYAEAHEEYTNQLLPPKAVDYSKDGGNRKVDDAPLPGRVIEFTRQHEDTDNQRRVAPPVAKNQPPFLRDIPLLNDLFHRPEANQKVAEFTHRIQSLRSAAESLAAGGFHDRAKDLIREAEDMTAHLHQMQGDTGNDTGNIEHRLARLEDEVHALRGEVRELRNMIEKLHQHLLQSDSHRERAR